MTKKIISMLTINILLYTWLVGCGGASPRAYEEDRYSPRRPVCPSEVVPFAKLMESAFSKDFEKCDVYTEIQFVGTGRGKWASNALQDFEEKGYITFRALPVGQIGVGNPMSGGVDANYIVIPKSKSEPIFSAKSGDTIPLYGKIFAKGWSNMTEIIFVAQDIRKPIAQTEPQNDSQSSYAIKQTETSTSPGELKLGSVYALDDSRQTLSTWIGKEVHIKMKDGSKHEGVLSKIGIMDIVIQVKQDKYSWNCEQINSIAIVK